MHFRRPYRALVVIGCCATAFAGGMLLYRFRPSGHDATIERAFMLMFAGGMLLAAVAALRGRR
jgi:hypothetical protein